MRILQYSFFLAAGLFLVWWQLRSMTEAETAAFMDALRRVDYIIVVPVFLMAILSFISRALRWKLLMEPLGYDPALKNVFSATMAGYLANAAVPRLGEVLKCSLLAKYEKLRIDKLVGTIIVERAFDLLCYAVFIALTLVLQIDKLKDLVRDKLNAPSSGSGYGMVLLLLILISTFFLFKFIMRRYPDKNIMLRIRDILEGFREGIASVKNLKKRKAFLIHTFFIWLMYFLQIYVGFFAMEETNGLSPAAACSVLSLATLAMILTPGGIGSFPVFVMQTLALYEISHPAGNAFGWLMWGVNTFIIILAGLISIIMLPLINKKTQA